MGSWICFQSNWRLSARTFSFGPYRRYLAFCNWKKNSLKELSVLNLVWLPQLCFPSLSEVARAVQNLAQRFPDIFVRDFCLILYDGQGDLNRHFILRVFFVQAMEHSLQSINCIFATSTSFFVCVNLASIKFIKVSICSFFLIFLAQASLSLCFFKYACHLAVIQ